MKRIYLVRHAKSSWSQHDLPDIDRPLNNRGYKNAHEMSRFLLNSHHKGDVFLSSPAIRALSTALIFARAGLIKQEQVQILPALYESSPAEYLDLINKLDDKHSNVFIFAHNPTISEVLNILCDRPSEDMTTCNVAILDFAEENWAEIIPGTGKKSFVFTPDAVS